MLRNPATVLTSGKKGDSHHMVRIHPQEDLLAHKEHFTFKKVGVGNQTKERADTT